MEADLTVKRLQTWLLLVVCLVCTAADTPAGTGAETPDPGSPHDTDTEPSGWIALMDEPTATQDLTNIQDILRDSEYQTGYPNGVDSEVYTRRPFTVPQGNATLTQIFLVGAAIFVLFLVSTYLLREARDRRILREAREEIHDESAPVRLDIRWEDIEDLVRHGRFAPAVRELLRKTFESLATQQRVPLREALTSREIVRQLRLSTEGRAALSDLATTVENSLFGGENVSRIDYERCLAAYHSLVDTLRATPARPESVR